MMVHGLLTVTLMHSISVRAVAESRNSSTNFMIFCPFARYWNLSHQFEGTSCLFLVHCADREPCVNQGIVTGDCFWNVFQAHAPKHATEVDVTHAESLLVDYPDYLPRDC